MSVVAGRELVFLQTAKTNLVPTYKTMVFSLNVNEVSKKCFLKNVLYVPKLECSLISVGVLSKYEFQISFHQNYVNILLERKLCATGCKVRTLYVLDFNKHKENALLADLTTCHERLEHPSYSKMLRMSH